MQGLPNDGAAGLIAVQFAELVAELHDRGDGRVKGLAATIVIAHFGNGLVGFAAGIFLSIAQERLHLSVGTGPAAACNIVIFHRRLRNRLAPSTPESDHSSDCSGGAANMLNRRTVSAP